MSALTSTRGRHATLHGRQVQILRGERQGRGGRKKGKEREKEKKNLKERKTRMKGKKKNSEKKEKECTDDFNSNFIWRKGSLD